tara:strand:+ start:2197 stop:2385 length:189 start_codon:yes stop_codon:yes gene_type:complete
MSGGLLIPKLKEVNVLSMVFQLFFGTLIDRLKELIRKLKEKFKKPRPLETIVIHQHKDYNKV